MTNKKEQAAWETGPLELYIHIPFCERKCLYCDFLSAPAPVKTWQAYTEKLVQEIRARGAELSGRTVTSVFVGGGTPSVLPAELMQRIFTAVYESFSVAEDAEITLEANPGSLSAEKANAWRALGANRISLGLQSADDAELKTLGRIHTYDEFLKSFQAARMAGFANINVDLMSAIPGQTVKSWRNTLKKVLMLRPEHISAYSLILEPGTPFYEHYVEHPEKPEEKKELDFVAVSSGRGAGAGAVLKSNLDGSSGRRQWPPLPDEDADREMYHLTKELLAEHGFSRYEISNYAKPGRECRHNIGYWTGVPYLGLGLGASSYTGSRRYRSTRKLSEYLEADMADAGALARDTEELTEKDRMAEFMFLGLRMTRGVSGSEFLERFGENLWNVYGPVLTKLQNQGLVELAAPCVRLTELGLDVSNQVFCEFLPD